LTTPSLKLPARGARRRVVHRTPQSLVRTSALVPGRELPLLVEPALPGVDLLQWAEGCRDWIEEKLLAAGALLFRGFGVESAEEFHQAVEAISGSPPLEYTERSSPRSEVSRNIYTSTDYPPDQPIFPHNEHSYKDAFPLRLYFYCARPSSAGGETPVVDCRAVYDRLPEEVRRRFEDSGYVYQRNFGEGFGLPWQTVFQTEDPRQVEEYCRQHQIEVEWRPEGKLRTRQRRRVSARHPRSGEWSWFNHMTFFHVSTLPPLVREALLADFAEEDLPNQTYYGDGTSIEPEVLELMRQAYLEEKVLFPWRAGDVLLIDNLLTAHAREPFEGARQVLVAMAEPVEWKHL
jgi:alpha-ketoglutarate-dependent taurine dioxygenase